MAHFEVGGKGHFEVRGKLPPCAIHGMVDQRWKAARVQRLVLKEAEIRQPLVVNGHNAHTPDSREACQAIAFYDNLTPEKSRPTKIEPLSIA